MALRLPSRKEGNKGAPKLETLQERATGNHRGNGGGKRIKGYDENKQVVTWQKENQSFQQKKKQNSASGHWCCCSAASGTWCFIGM